MLWFPLALLSAFSQATTDALTKKSLGGADYFMVAWLAVIYAKLAEESVNTGDGRAALERLKMAHHYVKRVEKTMVDKDKSIPELYFAGKPNPNTPLAWAMSMYIIAVQAMENIKVKMDRGALEGLGAKE